jgi:hypothetical protein
MEPRLTHHPPVLKLEILPELPVRRKVPAWRVALTDFTINSRPSDKLPSWLKVTPFHPRNIDIEVTAVPYNSEERFRPRQHPAERLLLGSIPRTADPVRGIVRLTSHRKGASRRQIRCFAGRPLI